jgi:hypothetical protein
MWLNDNIESVLLDILRPSWGAGIKKDVVARNMDAACRNRQRLCRERIPKAIKDEQERTRDYEQSQREYLKEYVDKARKTIAHERSTLAELEQWTLGSPPSFPEKVSITDLVWEQTIMSGKYVVGFVDMAVTFNEPHLTWRGISIEYLGDKGEYELTEEFKGWCFTNDPDQVGWDIGISYHNTLLVEVKSSIPSLGEAIRQIRMYQEYQPGIYAILCPDDRFAIPLKAQGIEFIKAP